MRDWFLKMRVLFDNFLGTWIQWITRYALIVILFTAIFAGGTLYYVVNNLGINTDTADMLSPDLPFRKNAIKLKEFFPQLSDSIVIVLDGNNATAMDQGAELLVKKLRRETKTFTSVFDPRSSKFFMKNGLLYLSVDELQALIDRLSASQPFIGALSQDTSIVSLLSILSDAIGRWSTGDNAPIDDAIPLLSNIVVAIKTTKTTNPQPVNWQQIMGGTSSSSNSNRRLILVKPAVDFGSLQPGKAATSKIREIADEIGLQTNYRTRLRLTGSIPLAQDELSSVADGMGIAAIASLILVLLLLIWGLKSVSLVFGTLFTLIIGLIWTAGFAAITVGSLNLISVAFAILFIGLSVDFGIHYCLRYQESLGQEVQKDAALKSAITGTGRGLTLAAICAAIGFYSFLPTDYIGLAELGFIAGSGMFIALFSNLTVLPAFLALMPVNKQVRSPINRPRKTATTNSKISAIVIVVIFVTVGIASAFMAPFARFDFDPLNLRNKQVESMQTLLDLTDDPLASPYTIEILAKDIEESNLIKRKLAKAETVASVFTPENLVPTNQDEKLAQIEEAAFFLGPALNKTAPDGAHSIAAKRESFKNFQSVIFSAADNTRQSKIASNINSLNIAAIEFDRRTGLSDQAIIDLERNLLGGLSKNLKDLNLSLQAELITLGDLPNDLRSRYVAKNGKVRVEVASNLDIRDPDNLNLFTAEILNLLPEATGTPIIIQKAGDTVVRAFWIAGLITIIAIALLLILIFRHLHEIVLIFAPLVVSAMLVIAFSVLTNIPFNFANIIVLPLLFGLGVASSIHLVMRFKENHRRNSMKESTSTPRAVFFSALTTIGSFASLSISSHPGTASMGILLTVAITITLVSALVFLQSLLVIWPPKSRLTEIPVVS